MPMENDSLQTIIDRRLSSLKVPDDLLSHIDAKPQRKKARVIRLRRTLALAAVFCFAFVFSINVVATGTPPGQGLFSFLGDQFSSFLQPINHTCTDNGIQTDIIAAINDNDLVDIYVSVKDLNGSRVNENTMLGDVKLSGLDIDPWVERVRYDSTSKSATFRIQGACGQNLDGKKLSLSIGSILLNEKEFTDFNTGITVSDIQNAYPDPSLRSVSSPSIKITGDTSDAGVRLFEENLVLNEAPSNKFDSRLFPWGSLTAAGVTEDGALRLQCKLSEIGQYAQIYDVFLMDSEQNKDLELLHGSIDFGVSQTTDQYANSEYLIPLPENLDTETASVAYSGVVYEDIIYGKWATTFRLESVSKEQTLEPEITINGYYISQIQLSPMGVSVVFKNNNSNAPVPSISVYDNEGNVLPSDGIFSTWSDDNIIVKTRFECPVPINTISKIQIDETEVFTQNTP